MEGFTLQHKELTHLDPLNPYVPFKSGTYELSITVPGNADRRMLAYIPADTQSSTAGIMLLPPSGVSAKEFLTKSNWMEIADGEETKEKLVLFVLESGSDGWDTGEAYKEPSEDVAYVLAAVQEACLRNLVCVHEAKYYIMGYKAGGTVALMAAMARPAGFAGAATIDALPVKESYLESAGEDYAVYLMGFEDEDHLQNIKNKDIPLPVWMIAGEWMDDSPEAKHFLHACGCDEKYSLLDRQTRMYVRTKQTPYPVNQEKEAYRVWISKMKDVCAGYGRSINRRIWKDFLYGVRRWMADPGGNLRLTEDPVRDLEMEYHYEEVDGFMREWYLYLPESVKRNPEKKVPLVIACHGYSCSGEIYQGNSCWHKVADTYGFMVLYPTAIYGMMESTLPEGGVATDNVPLPTWNCRGVQKGRPYEITYFEHMIQKTEATHALDKERIYITGHSNGSMITEWLGVTHPEWFAAIAPCSGIIHMAGAERMLEEPEALERQRTDLPVWMFGGEKETWLMDATPTKDNGSGKTIHAWWEMNDMPGDAPETFDDDVLVRERWHDWTYEKNGMPMIKFSGIDYFPHATMPEMSFRIWEEFFSKYSRKDGKIIYQG